MSDALLKEDGDALLKEDGDKILLESADDPEPPVATGRARKLIALGVL